MYVVVATWCCLPNSYSIWGIISNHKDFKFTHIPDQMVSHINIFFFFFISIFMWNIFLPQCLVKRLSVSLVKSTWNQSVEWKFVIIGNNNDNKIEKKTHWLESHQKANEFAFSHMLYVRFVFIKHFPLYHRYFCSVFYYVFFFYFCC